MGGHMAPPHFGNRDAESLWERKVLIQSPAIRLGGVPRVPEVGNLLEQSTGVITLPNERASRPLNYIP
jgi:hypothetical protein